MPAVNPRITITLQPAVHAALRKLSVLTGNSQSSMVAELLEQSLPVFERMARVIESAQVAQDAVRTEIASSLERAQAKLEDQLHLSLEVMDEGFAPIIQAAEEVKRRKAGAGGKRVALPPRPPSAGASTPVPVTRGLGQPGKGRKGGRNGRV